MYTNQTNFSIKNVILQFLFVALFIFILVWLFPLKSDLTNAVNSINNNDLSVLTDRIFNENIISMKDSAKSYYTTPRLPKNIGDKVKITLGDMLDKKIILPFNDKNGDACDLNESYVEITKYDEEFIMKVNLKCGEVENYLLVYMGCYDYCTTALCEKETADVVSPTVYSAKKTPSKAAVVITNTNTNTNTVVVNPTPVVNKEYLYEYNKTTAGYYTETDWSAWSTTAVSESSTVSVRTNTVTESKLIGYNVTRAYDYDSPIYATKVVNTGTETILVCNNWGYVSSGTATTYNGEWSYTGYVSLYEWPTNTDTVRYEFVRFFDETCSESCSSTTGMIFKKYVVGSSSVNLSTYQCTSSSYQTTTLSVSVKTITGYNMKIISKVPVYKDVATTYYSYKTKTYIAGTSDTKWSIYNDTTLLSAGYGYTGNKREK